MNDARELVVLTSLSINQLTHLGFSLFAAPTGHISRLDQTALFYWTCSPHNCISWPLSTLEN